MWTRNILCIFLNVILLFWNNNVSADTCPGDEFNTYFNGISETLEVGQNVCQKEDCTDFIVDTSAYSNITMATNPEDCFKYFSVELKNPTVGNASIVLKESISDLYDIDHIDSIFLCNIQYTCKDGTKETQANFRFVAENDNAPKFFDNNTATVNNMSKQFPPGIPIEVVYPELHIIAEDIDYTVDQESGDNVIECIVDDDPSDLIDCSTTLVDDHILVDGQKRGVYKFSLSLKRSIDSDVPNPYTFKLKTTDKGNPPLNGSNTQDVIINFKSTDQFPPDIENFYYPATILNATWTSPQILVTIKASDGDVDINDTIIYSIDDENSLPAICKNGIDCFAIDRKTGDFSWNNDLSDKSIRSGLIEVLVKATEDNNYLKRSSTTVVVIAVAGDDHPPKLDQETYQGTITKDGTMVDIPFTVSDSDTALSSFVSTTLIGESEHTDNFEIVDDNKLKLKAGFDMATAKLPAGGRVSFMLQVTDKNDTTKMDKSLVVITFPWNIKNPKFTFPSITGTVNNDETEVTLDKLLTAEDGDEIKSELVYALLDTDGSEEFSLDSSNPKDVKIKFTGDSSEYRRVTLVIKASEKDPSADSDARMDVATVSVAIGNTIFTLEPTTPTLEPTTTTTMPTLEPTTTTTTPMPTTTDCPTPETPTTAEPTTCPTPEPCDCPTPEPSPTVPPTSSDGPTDGSTKPTTIDPTTDGPTTCPTVEPITCPTVEPCTTVEPKSSTTDGPIKSTTDGSTEPTTNPTDEPTTSQTIDPTPCPTNQPLTCPTVEPITCPTVEPCPGTTPPPGDETVTFMSNDAQTDHQYVGYPNFVMLQNSVPMPITRVLAVSSNPLYNSQITYAATDTNFHVDKSSGEIFLNNPKSQIYVADVCSTPCSFKVTATLETHMGIKAAETTVTVTSLEEAKLAVFSSNTSVDEAQAVVDQINMKNTDVWFRLVNTQPLPSTRTSKGSLLFLTARGGGAFMDKNEAANEIDDMDGVDFTDDITIHHPTSPTSSNGGLVTAVIVLGILLALIPLAALTFLAYKNKSAILSRLPARNSGQKMDKLGDPNDGYSDVNYFNSNDLETENKVINNNINKPRMGQPAIGNNNNGLMREMSTTLEKRMDTKQNPPMLYNTMDPPNAVARSSPPLDVSKPVGEARPLQFVKPPQKKKAPTVPAVDQTEQEDVGVRFNEKAEVMEVEKEVDKRSIARSVSSSSSGSSMTSSSATSSDDEDVTVM